MNVSLSAIYGTTIAANPHARSRDALPLVSKKFGTRRVRRHITALVRKHGHDAVMKRLEAAR